MVKAIDDYNNTPATESIALREKHEGPVIKFLLQDHQGIANLRRRLQQLLDHARHTYSTFSSTISDPRSFVEKCTRENTRRTSASPRPPSSRERASACAAACSWVIPAP
jgi:hypothetical protein